MKTIIAHAVLGTVQCSKRHGLNFEVKHVKTNAAAPCCAFVFGLGFHLCFGLRLRLPESRVEHKSTEFGHDGAAVQRVVTGDQWRKSYNDLQTFRLLSLFFVLVVFPQPTMARLPSFSSSLATAMPDKCTSSPSRVKANVILRLCFASLDPMGPRGKTRSKALSL